MSDYQNKSPEKSSPSFPEDDDDNVMDFDRSISPSSQTENNQNPFKNDSFNISAHDNVPKPQENSKKPSPDLEKSTMDDNEYELDPKQTSMTEGDKKVHWTNENIVALLDCVENHLNDFSVSRKHKFVWQIIGQDMEPLGFNTEHCYNKWKNLRRDVRLLVNNPLKVVRNADILKRVARLILIIYPNVDAYTMQVNDRSMSKSNPSTPNFKRSDSPSMAKLASLNVTPKTPQQNKQNPPSTVLFTNIAPAPFNNNNNNNPSGNKMDVNNNNANSNPLLFNPASFLVQSQMFNDLLKQQNVKLDDETFAQLINNNNNTPDPNNNNTVSPNQFIPTSNNSNVPVNSLASTLLNSIYTATNTNNNNTNLLSSFVENLLNNTNPASGNPNSGQGLFDRLNLADELNGVVEKLRDEETVHLRLTEMITHLAEELRASGYRRQAILDKIATHIKSTNITGNINSNTNSNSPPQMNNNNNNSQMSDVQQQLTNSLMKHNAAAMNGQNCMEPVNSFG